MPISLHQPAVSRPYPSRYSNPFATCWTRPGAIEYQFNDDQTVRLLVSRIAAARWWGEIVGPHGSGKSTLLAALHPHLQATGREIHSIALRDGQRHLPREFWSRSPQPNAAIVIIDGFEQLGRFSRWKLKQFCRRTSCGLLVTSHTPTGFPTIHRTFPHLATVQQLVEHLCQRTESAVSPQDIAASHARHGSNVREIFFDLYDRHEALRRLNRTSPAATT